MRTLICIAAAVLAGLLAAGLLASLMFSLAAQLPKVTL